MSRDKKFFDMYSLVIGGLLVAAVGILVVAISTSGPSQDTDLQDADEYQAAVTARIRPLGQVYLPGDELQAPTVETAIEPEPVVTAMSGPQVYNTACLACHGAGIGGAPILGDVKSWGPRVAQGVAVLKNHAINGFTGSMGYMPPKGGRIDLSDREINDAVDYMISEAT